MGCLFNRSRTTLRYSILCWCAAEGWCVTPWAWFALVCAEVPTNAETLLRFEQLPGSDAFTLGCKTHPSPACPFPWGLHLLEMGFPSTDGPNPGLCLKEDGQPPRLPSSHGQKPQAFYNLRQFFRIGFDGPGPQLTPPLPQKDLSGRLGTGTTQGHNRRGRVSLPLSFSRSLAHSLSSS